eukprot:3941316-Rhodomonas_salina.3
MMLKRVGIPSGRVPGYHRECISGLRTQGGPVRRMVPNANDRRSQSLASAFPSYCRRAFLDFCFVLFCFVFVPFNPVNSRKLGVVLRPQ